VNPYKIVEGSGASVVKTSGHPYDIVTISATGTGTTDHSLLDNRDIINQHPTSAITGLDTALSGKVDDGQVLTDVPAGAVFTDTTYTSGDFDHNSLANTHNLTTDINHDSLTNTHNLTTDIDHNSITNNHNLTTDIDHNTITNNHNLTTDISHDSIADTGSANQHPTSSITGLDTALSNKVDDSVGEAMNISLGGYQHFADYDDPFSADTGLRCHVRDGIWYLAKDIEETNDIYVYIEGERVLTTADEGTGNGLDADTTDGKHVNIAASSNWAAVIDKIPMVNSSGVIEFGNTVDFHATSSSNDFDIRAFCTNNVLDIIGPGDAELRVEGDRVLTVADGGAGSGIDADLVDDMHADEFVYLTGENNTNLGDIGTDTNLHWYLVATYTFTAVTDDYVNETWHITGDECNPYDLSLYFKFVNIDNFDVPECRMSIVANKILGNYPIFKAITDDASRTLKIYYNRSGNDTCREWYRISMATTDQVTRAFSNTSVGTTEPTDTNEWRTSNDTFHQVITSEDGAITTSDNLLSISSSNFHWNGVNVLTSDDEGSGNNLDADTVDGKHANTSGSSSVWADVIDDIPVIDGSGSLTIGNELDFLVTDGDSPAITAHCYSANELDFVGSEPNSTILKANNRRLLTEDDLSSVGQDADTVDDMHAIEFVYANGENNVLMGDIGTDTKLHWYLLATYTFDQDEESFVSETWHISGKDCDPYDFSLYFIHDHMTTFVTADCWMHITAPDLSDNAPVFKTVTDNNARTMKVYYNRSGHDMHREWYRTSMSSSYVVTKVLSNNSVGTTEPTGDFNLTSDNTSYQQLVTSDGTSVISAPKYEATTGTGDIILDWHTSTSTSGKMWDITDQGGLAIGCDSAMFIHAGDNTPARVADAGIVAGTTGEDMFITADNHINFRSNLQGGWGSSFTLTLTNAGYLQLNSTKSINEFSNDNTLGDSSEYSLVTENAVKSYVDTTFVTKVGSLFTGDVTLQEGDPTLILDCTTSTNNSRLLFQTTTDQDAEIIHEMEDADLIGTGQAFIIQSVGSSYAECHLEVEGDVYSRGARSLTTDDEGSDNGLDADTLDTYHASSFAKVNSAAFTASIRISATTPGIYLKESDSTDLDWFLVSNGGSLSFQTRDDAESFIATALGINHTTLLAAFTGDVKAPRYESTAASGDEILDFHPSNGVSSKFWKITDLGGLAIGCDSPMFLHAGDDTLAKVADAGITSDTTAENMYLTADGTIWVRTGLQGGWGAGPLFTFSSNGTFELPHVDSVAISEFSSDATLVDNSDSAVPTEKAVKTYVDTNTISSEVDDSFSGDLTGSGMMKLTNEEAQLANDAALWLSGTTGAIMMDSAGQKRISWNDSGGNFLIRCGNYYNDGDERYVVAGDGATSISCTSDSSNGSIVLKAAVTGTNADDPVVWGPSLSISPTACQWNNNNLLTTGDTLNADTLNGSTKDDFVAVDGDTMTGILAQANRVSRHSNLYETYRYFWGGGTDQNWKNIASITINTDLYTAMSFVINITNADTNYGHSVNAVNLEFYVSASRSDGTLNGLDTGEVSGPMTGYVRLVKTATGFYEIQARQVDIYRHMTIECRAISDNGGVGVTYHDTPTDGSTTGTIYTASAVHSLYAPKIKLLEGTTISEFSTDDSFSANSDDKVPTEKAVKKYISDAFNGAAPPTGLEVMDDGNGIGWILIGRTQTYYGDIGFQAVDLSYYTATNDTMGATGTGSFATGYGTTASGTYTAATGYLTKAIGNNSFVAGLGTEMTNTEGTALGKWNSDTSGTILEVGIGTDDGSRANALEVHTDGLVKAPGATVSEIRAGADSVIPTKEYTDGICPIGSIIAWHGGHHANSANGSYSMIMASANTIAAVNTHLNPMGWNVCNGTAPNDSDSPIFNASNKYLPNLTDDRFIMGDTIAGNIGGSSTMSHDHSVNVPSIVATSGPISISEAQMPSHDHNLLRHTTSSGTGSYFQAPSAATSDRDNATPIGNRGSGSSHSHSINHDHAAFDSETVAPENRPKYLSCYYIMRIK